MGIDCLVSKSLSPAQSWTRSSCLETSKGPQRGEGHRRLRARLRVAFSLGLPRLWLTQCVCGGGDEAHRPHITGWDPPLRAEPPQVQLRPLPLSFLSRET